MSRSENLGELIASSRDSLIARWTALLKERPHPPVSEAELVDSVPVFLDRLAQALKELPSRERPQPLPLGGPALAHGHERLREGFSLEAVTWEYGVLRECILDLAEQAGLSLTLPEVRLLSRGIDEGIAQASSLYIHHRETAAEATLSRFRQLFESNIIGLIFFDLEGGITDANDAFLACVGYTREDLKAGRVDWRKLTPPEWLKQDEALVAELLTTGKHRAAEKAYVRKDGSHVPIVLASTFFHQSKREGIGFVLDISARRQAETALRESEARFRALADNIPQLAWMANPEGDIFWYNRRWYDYTGTTFEEMKGWGWKSVHDPGHVQRVEARFREAVASGQEWEDTFPLRGKEGQYRWFLSRAMPVRDEHGQVLRWFGTNTDVEEQRLQEAALRTAVQVREVFLTVAAHELKTPLTSLALRLAQLQRAAKGEQAGQAPRVTELRRLEAAASQMKRLMALVDSLLDVSRITHRHLQLTLENLDVGDVVREVIAAMEPQAERAGSRIEVNVASRVPGRFDRMRLEQVVTHLLSNAIKFGAGKPIQVALRVDGTRALLRIRDEGIGMEPDILNRLFEKFERGVSEQNYGGLGLGLYVTKNIVEAMGGTVTVQSALGQGAAFTVELPLEG